MYDSRPKDREGEPVEYVIPEAINATASKERQSIGGGPASPKWTKWLPESKAAFAGAAAIAIAEAVAIVVLVVL